jgi:hypothetical protein
VEAKGREERQKRQRVVAALVVVLAACSHGPPPDFAPNPAVVARITRIQMVTTPETVCPGEQIRADYEAVLNDSSTAPFERRYDKKHPPKLHVVFLRRTSPEAYPQEDGDWTTNRDPLVSAMNGFRLTAFLMARPSINTSAVVNPEYSCMPHAFGFSGATGGQNMPGEDGPDVTVRLGLLRSPYVDRLLVASIEVGQAPPFFVLADADRVPPSDWLIVETRGGRGGRGTDGAAGQRGSAGQAGCPGTAGGPGGAGGSGGAGAAGGRGGRVTVIGPQNEPFLVGLVEGRSVSGEGGPGGRGGKGGAGGPGGATQVPEGSPPDRRCMAASQGPNGSDGSAGTQGPAGIPGPRPQTLTVPTREVFAPIAPMVPELAALVDYAQGIRRRNP